MTARRLVPVVALLLTVAVGLALATRSDGGGGGSAEARVERIARELRCPVCQGLSVADSPSSTARAIRDDIRRRVVAGQSDEEIKASFVERYGEWILLKPRGSGVAVLVWAVPVAALVGAVGALLVILRRWQREPPLRASEADRLLVARALAERLREPAGEGDA